MLGRQINDPVLFVRTLRFYVLPQRGTVKALIAEKSVTKLLSAKLRFSAISRRLKIKHGRPDFLKSALKIEVF